MKKSKAAQQIHQIFNQANQASQSQQWEKAIRLYKHIQKISPDIPEILQNLAIAYRQHNQPAAAISIVEHKINKLGANENDYAFIGEMHCLNNNLVQALQAFEKSLNIAKSPQLYYKLLATHINLKQPQQALNILESLPYQQQSEFKLIRALSLHQLQEYKAAIECYQDYLQQQPSALDIQLKIAKCYESIGQFEQAEQHFKKILEIDENHLETLRSLISLKCTEYDLEQAQEYAMQVLHLQPDSTSFSDLACVFFRKKQYEQALEYFEKALTLAPNDSALQILNATVYFEKGEEAKGYQLFQQSIGYFLQQYKKDESFVEKLDHNTAAALVRYGYCCLNVCDWQQFKIIRPMLEDIVNKNISSQYPPVMSPFLSTFLLDYAEYNLPIAKCFASHLQYLTKLVEQGVLRNTQHLKIAYISPDFNNHPLGYIINCLFKYHDRDKFEVYAYSLNPLVDETQQIIEQSVDHYIDLSSSTNLEAAKSIAADQIDILIDLAGHTNNARPEILAYQPAPFQIHAWGYPGTMGLPTVQYHLNHKTVIPPDQQRFFTETILYHPNSAFASPGFNIKNKEIDRAAYGLPDDKFVFVNFNRNYRLDQNAFDSMLAILRQVQDSVLWLNHESPQAEQRLINYAKEQGITNDRLIFKTRGRLSDDWHHCLADLWLDTFKLSAGTATLLSLFAGLPVLTLQGQHVTNRLAANYLITAGLNELVAKNSEEYINIAVEYAAKGSFFEGIQDKMKAVPNSALFDGKSYIKGLEQCLLDMTGK